MRDEDEIQDMADSAADAAYKATRYPGMTYEEGVRAALDWMLGGEDEPAIP